MWIVIGSLLNLCFCLWMAVSPLTSFAEDVSFEATVNANKVGLSDMVELTLSVRGAKGDVTTIALPLIDGFDARYVGPSTKFTMINGVTSNEHAFIYDLFPSKVGHYQIPSVSVILDGQTYKTTPIDIDVVDKPADSSSSDSDGTASSDQSISDKVFMKAFTQSTEVYEGEKVPLVMKVFVKGLSLQLASVPSLSPDGFVADATANMQKAKETVNGVNYDLLKFDTNLYPTRTGKVNVGPFVAEGELVYRVRQSNDIFGDLFSNNQTRPLTLHAPAVVLNVLPLPEGKPDGFNGAVGQYDFKVSVGPSEVKVGDPLTLRMTITGQGRLKGLVPPVFNDSRFKTYDPQIKDEDKSKTIEQVIIPTTKDITEVPAISFSYFDPLEKKYKTVTQGPFPIKVSALATGEEFKAYGFVDKTKTSSDKPFVLKYDGLKGLAQSILSKILLIVKNLWFWLFVVIAAVVWLGFYFWNEFQDRLKKDEAFSRNWRADAKAKELLKNAKASLPHNNAKEFYGEVYKTLNNYLADKMHLPLASLNVPMIEEYLKKRAIDPSKLQTIKDLWERCDLARFASASMSQEQMTKDFVQLEDLIAYLPKILK
ncbi:MAG: protein BatD [Candidatus Omnitrophica bacterium]|nr:protein BatD [Candidatus Omnitrophota bacterium]